MIGRFYSRKKKYGKGLPAAPFLYKRIEKAGLRPCFFDYNVSRQ